MVSSDGNCDILCIGPPASLAPRPTHAPKPSPISVRLSQFQKNRGAMPSFTEKIFLIIV